MRRIRGNVYCTRKSEFRRRRCEYCPGTTDVHMGVNLAPKCRRLLLVRTADMCIVYVRVSSVGVDVSIAPGLLMFIWGSSFHHRVVDFS